MSKFWGNDRSESSSSSDEESSKSSSESSVAAKPTESRQQGATRWNAIEDSSSDEEGKRIVRSAKEKQWGNLTQIIRSMNNHKNIDDFAELQSGFESLLRGIQKARAVIEKEGVPPFFIAALASLETYINDKFANKELLKKLPKTKNLAFNTLRSKFRKTVEEYRSLIDAYKLNPQSFSDQEEGDHSSSSEDEEELSTSESSLSSSEDDQSSSDDQTTTVRKPRKQAMSGSESSGSSGMMSSDDLDWGSSGSESSDDESAIPNAAAGQGNERGLKVWGKRVDDKGKTKAAKKKDKTKVPKAAPALESTIVQSRAKVIVPVFALGEKIDADVIGKKLKEVTALRGRKGFDRSEQIRQLHEISDAAKAIGPQTQVEAVAHLISAYLDANLGAFMAVPAAQWMQVYEQISTALQLLKKHKDCYIPLLATDDDTHSEAEEEIAASSCTPGVAMTTATILRAQEAADVLGTREAKAKLNTALVLTSFLERLDDELTKALQLTDIHSDEYKIRLGQTIDLLALLWRGYMYFTRCDQMECARAVSLRILEQIYCKNNLIAQRMWDIVRKRLDADDAAPISSPNFVPDDIVRRLVQENLGEGPEMQTKVRAVLYLAYNESLRGRFHEARNLLQTTNMQDLALQCNISTQVLYNRNLVQIGLAAFSLGLTTEAHTYLSEVCAAAMSRYKELLAQGLSSFPRGVEKSPEQERLEKRRLLPYHMHIASDLVEAVHNICAMLLEVPYMAANPFDYTKKPIARYFRRLLETYDRQIFVGPPENPREIVMAATKALQKGDWKTCCSYLMSLKIWEGFDHSEKVKEIITNRVQQEALRTYIFRYAVWYDGFSVHQLSEMFSLPAATTHSIVSKVSCACMLQLTSIELLMLMTHLIQQQITYQMMIQGALSGSWDEAAECVLINRIERTPLQVLGLQLTEKIAQSVDQNETLLAYKNPKFIQTQASQRDDRMRRYDERWIAGGRNDYWPAGQRGGRWEGGGTRWDNISNRWGEGADRQSRFVPARQSVLAAERGSIRRQRR